MGTQRRGAPACLVGDCAGGQIGICWAFGTQGGTSQAGRDVCACVCVSVYLSHRGVFPWRLLPEQRPSDWRSRASLQVAVDQGVSGMQASGSEGGGPGRGGTLNLQDELGHCFFQEAFSPTLHTSCSLPLQ